MWAGLAKYYNALQDKRTYLSTPRRGSMYAIKSMIELYVVR